MPLAAKLNDQGTEHDGFHATPITAGSVTVFIDGLPAARLGDPLVEHNAPPITHPTLALSPAVHRLCLLMDFPQPEQVTASVVEGLLLAVEPSISVKK